MKIKVIIKVTEEKGFTTKEIFGVTRSISGDHELEDVQGVIKREVHGARWEILAQIQEAIEKAELEKDEAED